MTTKQVFVSYDGTDAQGIRAEVRVQKGVGKITKIDRHDNGKTANVTVKHAELKHPIHGFVNVTDPIFPLIEEAFESKADIHYRTEAQRKRSIDRSTPIADLRTTMEVAKENVTNIFAGINDNLSEEAVTNPAEDPDPAGRLRATTQDAAQNAAPAAAPSPPVRSSGANVQEEKPWTDYNTNGSPNLGSYSFGAALGVDTFATKLLAELGVDVLTGDSEDIIFTLAKDLLDITDYVQVAAYKGTLARANRAVASHAKVRGIVFTLVEEFFPIAKAFAPEGVNAEERSAWKNAVTSAAIARINRALRLGFPELFGPGSQVFVAPSSREDESKATPETIADLRALAKDSQMENLVHLSALLYRTFGTSKAEEVADSDLAVFIQFYGENGIENFLAVAEQAYADVNRS